MRTPAARYRRISHDREGRELGVERQGQDLDALAERRGLVFVGDYSDNDVSASTRSRKPRPGFRRMIEDAKAGKFKIIAAYTSGRLTRRPREFEDLIELAEHHGIKFQFVQSPEFDLNTAAGRRIARILSATDAGESEDISERVQRQKQQRAASGLYLGGPRPYGWGVQVGTKEVADKATGKKKKVPVYDVNQIVPHEADVIREATATILAGGTVRSIMRDLNERGVTTSTGRKWGQDAIPKLLMRPRNAGLMGRRGEPAGPAKWPAIVDESDWRTVVKILTNEKRRASPGNARKWLLSFLATCGVCGQPVICTGSIGGRPVYVCKTRKHVKRSAAPVDKYVERTLVARLSRPDAIKLLRVEQEDTTADLRDEVRDLRQRRRELPSLFSAGVFNKAEVTAEASKLDTRISDLESQIADQSRGSILAKLITSDDVAGEWERWPLDDKRAVIAAVLTVEVLPASSGRPDGWKPGTNYFDHRTVKLTPKRAAV